MACAIEGVGLGLRRALGAELLRTGRRIDWLEIIPENHAGIGGKDGRWLSACLERWPAVAHGTSLSLGGPDPLDGDYLAALASLSRRLDAPWWSDHLCWSSAGGVHLHDLLSLPFSFEAVEHLAGRFREAEARVGAPLVLENITFYARMPGGDLDEAGFLCAALEATGAGLLLDVNNVVVNCMNHGGDPFAFVDSLPIDRIRQIHVSGHTARADMIIDTHIGPVPEPVWALYRHTLRRAGRLVPTLIEWDTDIPSLDAVLDELDRARHEARCALTDAAPAAAGAMEPAG